MLFPIVLFASLASFQQTPTAAPRQPTAETAVAAVPATNATRPAADTVQICRTEPVTGSRFGRRVCRTAAQTEDERAASREMLRRMQGARMPDG